MSAETHDPQARAHVLIVDDEESIRSALRRVLRRSYQLSFASSGAEALELLQRERPDVIISDHLMPEMTGLELLKRCRFRYPHMGRIVLTGQAEMTMVIAAINEGSVFRFLTKPWDEDELKLTVHLAIEHARESRRDAGEESASHQAPSQPQALPQESEDQAAQAQLRDLEAAHPGLTDVQRDEEGAIVITAGSEEDSHG